jgi:hypothetical protein
MPEDSFEKARKAFFVSAETAPKPSVSSAKFLESDHIATQSTEIADLPSIFYRQGVPFRTDTT